MLVHDFIEMRLPMDAAVDAIADGARWTRALASAIDNDERTLLARFGIDQLFASGDATAEVRIGSPRRQERGTVVDVWWRVAAGAGPHPVMQADVSLSALAGDWTHLEFNGIYSPPGGMPSRVSDRVVLHHVVEHAVRLVLTRLVDELKGVCA